MIVDKTVEIVDKFLNYPQSICLIMLNELKIF